jgi:hypothetical protein
MNARGTGQVFLPNDYRAQREPAQLCASPFAEHQVHHPTASDMGTGAAAVIEDVVVVAPELPKAAAPPPGRGRHFSFGAAGRFLG